MTTKNMDGWLDALDDRLPQSEVFARLFPGLGTAFDSLRMSTLLSETLLGEPGRVVDCEPGKANYSPDGLCRLQYDITFQAHPPGETSTALVNARLFSSLEDARRFYEDSLLPLADQAASRADLAQFAQPVGLIAPLCMTVSVFPIDGLLPNLLGATDTRALVDRFKPLLPFVQSGEFDLRAIHLDLAHYGRHQRCVMRYRLQGEDPRTGETQERLIYGKVDADGQIEETALVVRGLEKQQADPNVPYAFTLPQTYGCLPDLHLLLMSAIPGSPVMKTLMKQWLKGIPPETGHLTLAEVFADCAEILLTIHGSQIPLGPLRSFETEAARLRAEIDLVEPVTPELADYLRAQLARVEERSHRHAPMPLGFSHGDYTYAQVIFDGKQAGLVDFDTACQAEAALDLGQFLAYMRLTFRKEDDALSPKQAGEVELLSRIFLDTYLTHRAQPQDEAHLRARVALYEMTSLIHLVLHSWQKFKVSRLKLALRLLEERMTEEARAPSPPPASAG